MPNRGLTQDPGFLTVSNLMSLGRIPLGLAFVFVDGQVAMATLLVTAGATDVLDGLVARASHTQSQIGELLDPLCDKLFVLLALSGFMVSGHLDLASLLILTMRDVFTAGSYLTGRLASVEIPYSARVAGKVATALQFFTLLSLILASSFTPFLVLMTGLSSVVAIVDYGERAVRESHERSFA